MAAGGQRCLQLHAVGLNFSSSTVELAGSSSASGSSSIGASAPQPAPVLRYDAANERIVLSLPFTPAAGDVLRLRMSYSGVLSAWRGRRGECGPMTSTTCVWTV
jgi:hypothetical protein